MIHGFVLVWHRSVNNSLSLKNNMTCLQQTELEQTLSHLQVPMQNAYLIQCYSFIAYDGHVCLGQRDRTGNK